VQDEYEVMLRRRNRDRRFRLIPVLLGDAPELPFLGNIRVSIFATRHGTAAPCTSCSVAFAASPLEPSTRSRASSICHRRL
jgi:hypothetical protein